MEEHPLTLDADVGALPPGTKVGAWRLKGGSGRGVYGAVYRAVREGDTTGRIVALKLALYPRDARFQREVALLRRVLHPSVPRLLDWGEWRHPDGFHYPYLVMEYVQGEPLYDWAARRNPSQREVMRLLAQAARALQATHEAGGVHRDVKGDNSRVRATDGRLVLLDFGAGHYEGAERLTASPLPPGTPAYRSPEAWEFSRFQVRRSHALYVAGPADDVFALGVMAYRLVTDEYPPFTDASSREGKCWQAGGSGPRPPMEVNPRVGERLDAVIRRMLSLKRGERGTAKEQAKALERAVEQGGAELEEPLFEWETRERTEWSREDMVAEGELGRRVRRRDREEVRKAAEGDAARKVAAERQEAEARARAVVRAERGGPRTRRQVEWLWLAATVAGAVALWPRDEETLRAEREAAVTRRTTGEEQRDGGSSYVGDAALMSAHSTEQVPSARRAVALEVPPRPLPGQLKPDGNGRCLKGQYAINGGCWMKVEITDLDDCKGMGNGYEHKGGCYAPIYPPARAPTSVPVKPQKPEQ